jgi:UDP-N-acetylglucosamine acyltransferase
MPTIIHPTAIIMPGAKIGENCQIGPYCVIGPQVTLGDGCILDSHVVVDGLTTLGRNNRLYSFACIGKQTQDLKFKGGIVAVEIGDNNTFREFVTVHAATTDGNKTILGSNINLLAYCHIAHECVIGDGVIMSNCTQIAGHVTVGKHVVIGGMGGVHQFVKIGDMCMVGATCKLVQDLVPYSLADGNPAEPVTVNKVGMQRHGISAETISQVQKAHKLLFRSNLTTEAALKEIETLGDSPEIRNLVDFVKSAERGLARPKKG